MHPRLKTTAAAIALAALCHSATLAAPPTPAQTPAPARAALPAAQKTAAPADDISAPARGAKDAKDRATSLDMSPTTFSSAGAKDRLLWDYWYTVTVNKVIHYEYYNDHAELKKGRVIFQNRAWKQEEDFINEEQLGVFAENNPELSPLFFNFHSNYRSTETSIDGNVKDGKELIVRVRKGNTELPLIKKMIPHKTFFSELFPVWLGNRLATFKTGQVYSFLTILEDNLESEFITVDGQVRAEPPDEFATKTHTVKLTVNLSERKSLWWIEANGAPLRMEMPLQKTVIQRVPKENATKFLDEGS